MEFLLKIFGLGVVKYFSSVWNCLDAFIVAVSWTIDMKERVYYNLKIINLGEW